MRLRILALLGALLFATAASADTDAQKLATVRQMIDAWNTRNWQQVYDLFAADGVLQSMRVSTDPTNNAVTVVPCPASSARRQVDIARAANFEGL